MAFNLGNLPLKKVKKVLIHQGCKYIHTKGGHEKWTRSDLLRPIVIQTNIDPVPAFIVRQIMRTLNIDLKKMESILKEI
jgi:predicted RNA binding protein YcfA (HicA-like mRNA interferase family)